MRVEEKPDPGDQSEDQKAGSDSTLHEGVQHVRATLAVVAEP